MPFAPGHGLTPVELAAAMPAPKHFVRSNLQRSASLVNRRKSSVIDSHGVIQTAVIHTGAIMSPTGARYSCVSLFPPLTDMGLLQVGACELAAVRMRLSKL